MKIGVLLGSVRQGRKAAPVADWVLRGTEERGSTYELIDLAENELPHLAEPVPPKAGRYSDPRTKAWAEVIGGYDGFVIVTPEYNHGMPGVLKNAIDHLYAEWTGKTVGLVGYGVAGGAHSLGQLRSLVEVLGMHAVQPQVELNLANDFHDGAVATEGQHGQVLDALLTAVEARTSAGVG